MLEVYKTQDKKFILTLKSQKSSVCFAKVACKIPMNKSCDRGVCDDPAELALNLLINFREKGRPGMWVCVHEYM